MQRQKCLAQHGSQQSVHPTLGSLARFQAFFCTSTFFQADGCAGYFTHPSGF